MKKIIVLLAAMVLMSHSAFATIAGTPHDLGVEICIFCHTPHNGEAIAPLWNGGASVDATTFYNSNTLDATVSGFGSLCLSCHDGNFAGISIAATIGTDLSDDHPVGFDYTVSANNDPEIMPISDSGVQYLLGGGTYMGCTTCHDVHDNFFGAFLKISNNNSEMCTTCHLK